MTFEKNKGKNNFKNCEIGNCSFNFLVFNVGSSSVKVKAFNVDFESFFEKKNNEGNKKNIKGKNNNLKESFFSFEKFEDFFNVKLLFEKNFSGLKSFSDYNVVLKNFVSSRDFKKFKFDFFVHRVVHGFDFSSTSFFNSRVKSKILKGCNIAPLHNIIQLKVLEFFDKNFAVRQIVVFDSFIYDFSLKEKVLPLNRKIAEKHKIFRVGFHGLNHFFMYKYFFNKKKLYGKKVVTVHLGSGSSVSAVFKDKFLFNSMSFSPSDGIVMSSRTGSLDPFIPLYLLNFYSKSKVERIINFESGFFGLSGEKDFYTIFKGKSSNEDFKFVYDYFIDSVVKNILSAVSVLEGLDFVVFSGAIGFNKIVQKDIVRKLKKIGFDFSFSSVKADEEKVLLFESLKFLGV